MISNRFLLGLVLLVSANSLAASGFRGLDTHRMQDDFRQQNQILKGTWQGGRNWKGILCTGSYDYEAKLQGVIQNVDFKLSEEEFIDVTATVLNGYARIEGSIVSEYSACLPLPGWLGIGVDRIDLVSRVYFIENSTKLKVKVYRTRLGRLHIGTWVPRWVENKLTDVMNRTLVFVWKTQLGDWLNAKISNYLNTKLPNERH